MIPDEQTQEQEITLMQALDATEQVAACVDGLQTQIDRLQAQIDGVLQKQKYMERMIRELQEADKKLWAANDQRASLPNDKKNPMRDLFVAGYDTEIGGGFASRLQIGNGDECKWYKLHEPSQFIRDILAQTPKEDSRDARIADLEAKLERAKQRIITGEW